MRKGAVTIHKFEENTTNEDDVRSLKKGIAVSDGAGGGGVFADRWSRYLLDKLPLTPVTSAGNLDKWIGRIWEPFYNQCEAEAKKTGGLLLDKFYDEGSFATLAAVWQTKPNECRWMTYGDSVVFHYRRHTKELEHSFTELSDFNNPPYLINCKDELDKSGFKQGVFHVKADSIVFVASDTLSHYLLMGYELVNRENYEEELIKAENAHSKNSSLIKRAAEIYKGVSLDYEKDFLKPVLKACCTEEQFKALMQSLEEEGVLGHDDYSFAFMSDLYS